MFSLTDEQIAFIENDIRVRGITSPDLSIDLVDHICCLIEDRLDEYNDFGRVYQETLLLFGDKGLKEIQDETNRLLTFKNYYIMDKTMKISGYISSLMILFGAFFKLQHWPGANAILIFGTFLLTVLFLPLLFILKFKSTAESNRSVLLSIIGFVAALLICTGVLFRIMHWPGARMTAIIGAVLLVLGYLPVYVLSVYKNTTNKINATATVIIIIAGVGLLVTELGTGITRPVSDSFWRGVTESNQLLTFTNNENLAVYTKHKDVSQVKDSSSSPDPLAMLQLKTDELMNYLDGMKIFLIAASAEISEEEAKKLSLDDLRSFGGDSRITELLIEPENAVNKYTAAKLKTMIESYQQTVKNIAPAADLSMLETGMLKVYGEPVAWEKANFEELPIPMVVYNLIRIQLSIRSCERAALNQITGS